MTDRDCGACERREASHARTFVASRFQLDSLDFKVSGIQWLSAIGADMTIEAGEHTIIVPSGTASHVGADLCLSDLVVITGGGTLTVMWRA